jgi:hypothetical protein
MAMSNLLWIALLVVALAAVACLSGRKPAHCCEAHAAENPDKVEVGYCSSRGD